ncbi:MAG: 4Fe-4S ferredoxin, partial [Elusimicrobiota bacterium]
MILAFASLFCLILAAHFLRMGALPGVLVCLALPLVTAITRARWALRSLQGLLILGSLNWIATALRIGAERRLAGEPWLRMALILGTV